VNGTVESIQLKAGLIDVKIYEPGHKSHCLIKSYPADAVTVVDEHEEHGADSYAELQRRVEGERSARSNQELMEVIKGMASAEDARLKSIDDSIVTLLARVDALEAKVALLENPEPPITDKAESA